MQKKYMENRQKIKKKKKFLSYRTRFFKPKMRQKWPKNMQKLKEKKNQNWGKNKQKLKKKHGKQAKKIF